MGFNFAGISWELSGSCNPLMSFNPLMKLVIFKFAAIYIVPQIVLSLN